MKNILFLLMIVSISFAARAQNEFANEKFYSAVKKITADGQNGFALYKGAKTGGLGSIMTFYKTTLLLPGADSGKITIPVIGHPDASYDFKPAKTLELASQKIKYLAAALKTASSKTLYEQQKTSELKGFTFYKTLLYTTASPGLFDAADFELYTTLDKGVYMINLKIKGSVPVPVKTTKLKPDNDLTTKIKTVLSDVDKLFTGEKTTLKETTKYDTRYNTRTQLFGFGAEVKETSYNISWYYYLGADILTGANESTDTYNKLKAACAAAGIGFGAEKVEGTHKQVFASMKTSSGKEYTFLLGCYAEQYGSSVSLMISRYK
jgi:hypothetical protein